MFFFRIFCDDKRCDEGGAECVFSSIFQKLNNFFIHRYYSSRSSTPMLRIVAQLIFYDLRWFMCEDSVWDLVRGVIPHIVLQHLYNKDNHQQCSSSQPNMIQ